MFLCCILIHLKLKIDFLSDLKNKRCFNQTSRSHLKLLPQMVQPIANPVHLSPDVGCVTSLSNVHSLVLFKSLKELTLVVRSGKYI